MLFYVFWLKNFALHIILLLQNLYFWIELLLLFNFFHSLLVLLLKDEVNCKDRSNTNLWLYAYLASEELTDTLANAKSKSDSIGVHLVGWLELTEELKKLLLILLANTSSIILHWYLNCRYFFTWLLRIVRNVNHFTADWCINVNFPATFCKFYSVWKQI